MNDPGAKQQITERIKNVTNILVTVSNNPSVDELSAALGLTLMLNKFDKHATAVFSGAIPPAITFLDPNKTFENTVDSLRDFIIALDKEKADRLRYRVEDDVVRIFITPYRTRISEEDLEFTHGDFNVELVLALGVENQEVLDAAIAAHGRILHDATVATINAQNKTSNLGSIDWQDSSASSLCEMLVSISEALQPGLLDEQIATALLTGIVAATNRFSNRQTSPKSMTMAAQLMAAGANQQLIAAKLEENLAISNEESKEQPDGSTPLEEGGSKKLRSKNNAQPKEKPPKKEEDLGEVKVNHDDNKPAPPDTKSAEPVKAPFLPSATIEEHTQRNKQLAGEQALDEALSKLGTPAAPVQPSLDEELKKASTIQNDDVDLPSSEPAASQSWRDHPLAPGEPSLGGELNATSKQLDDVEHEEESNRNKVTLEHDSSPSVKGRTILPPPPHEETSAPMSMAVSAPPAAVKTLSDIEQSLSTPAPAVAPPPDAETARQELDKVLENAPAPTVTPSLSALPPPPPLPELPDFSNLPPPLPPSNGAAPPPLDANGLAIPGIPPAPQAPPAAPAASEPGQFRIPGQ